MGKTKQSTGPVYEWRNAKQLDDGWWSQVLSNFTVNNEKPSIINVKVSDKTPIIPAFFIMPGEKECIKIQFKKNGTVVERTISNPAKSQ
ncbi:hypothetical protein N7462_004435 [Penicillium macrosclerotiorum]|uniref:uncharacterized protein n=1 Tax=Penicillium macrosclerotiorum TaxID=303699 RepID=UPI0025486E2F|nr:uncharacterized protein N7462_004435 [Penicillium macrosclerotiorum]KAJ5690043.1 hypothetical protein N7462_004435 [Penicillium macrosclerotiorum]